MFGKSIIKSNPNWNEDNVLVENTNTLKSSNAKRVDILIVDMVMPPVAIETSYTKGDADKDAKGRIGEQYKKTMDVIHTSIAVEIDEKYRKFTSLNENDIFKYSVHQMRNNQSLRFPNEGFLEGTYNDIARLAASTAVPKEKLEKVASEVGNLVNAAAEKLDMISDNKLLKIQKTLYQRSKLTGRRTTAVLWLNALFVQQMLYDGERIPETTRNPDECVEAWNKIYKINWRAIFKPAIDILDELKDTNPLEVYESLGLLLKAVNVIQRAKLGSEINIGAELFPILASDRKNSAAYYTQAHTAELLTALTINGRILDKIKQEGEIFEDFYVGDLACGTGTLLRSAYKQIRTYYGHDKDVQSMNKFHKSAMEKGLFGVDVSPIASHLAVASLAINSKMPYTKTNIGWVLVGNDDLTGSIEYMNKDAVTNLFSEGFGTSTGGHETSNENSVVIKHRSMSVILANPPYSRTRKGLSAFDIAGLSKKERNLCQIKWAKLIKDEDCIKTAGMAATFLCIANKKISPGGKIGFVLPRSAAHEDAWEKTRNMLERQFENVLAIVVRTGQARGKTALSADTKFEEMLLVATKKKDDDRTSSPIRCVTLKEPVTRIGEAAEIAKAITHSSENGTIYLGNTEIGSSLMFKSSSGAPWSMLGIEHDGLAAIADRLVKDGELCQFSGVKAKVIPMTTIGELFEVGPTHHRIGHLKGGDPIGAFKFYKITRQRDEWGKHRALWQANHKAQNTLVVIPTHRGYIVNANESKKMIKNSSTLFYARGMQWTSQTITAAITEQPVMGGSAWTALLHQDCNVKKAFSLWSNSIYGMIVYWACGGRTQLGRSRLQVKAISKVKCPKFDTLHKTKLQYAAREFDRLAKVKLLAACKSDEDDARHEINKVVSNMLGIKNYDEYKLTKLWCMESSVRGKPVNDQILW